MRPDIRRVPTMGPQPPRAPFLLIALILAMLLMAACARAGLPPAGAKEPPLPSESEPPGPFITWDQETTIPFLCYAIDRSSGGDRAFLSLWDLSAGKVTFSDKPLFQAGQRTGYGAWDGGARFLFGSDGVTDVDPRIRAESFPLPYSSEWWTAGLAVAPYNSEAVIAVYRGEDGNPLLDIRNHPLEGKVSLDLSGVSLPPQTRIQRPVGIEVSDDMVNVYFETSRPDVNPHSGERDLVQGVIRASYRPAVSMRPVGWRVVNPEVPSFVAGSGTSYAQIDGGLVLSREHQTSEFLDVLSGIVKDFPGLEQALKAADPAFTEPYVEDRCYGYKGFRFVITHCERTAEESVSQVLAFRGETLLGRIECVGSRITVFKGAEKTQEIVQPWESAWMWRFPQTVYAPGPPQSLYWEEYREIWMNARYPDLFAESMRADGALAEDNAIMLMERFTEDPTGFIRVLASTPEDQADRVGDQLAYNADYGSLDAFRKKVEEMRTGLTDGLAKGIASQAEVDAASGILERIVQFERRRAR